MSLWAKYFVVVLVAPMLAFALIDREARKVLATPGPWIAAAVALIVMAPHLVWLVQNDFLPLRLCRASRRAARAAGTTISGIRCNSRSASCSSCCRRW